MEVYEAEHFQGLHGGPKQAGCPWCEGTKGPLDSTPEASTRPYAHADREILQQINERLQRIEARLERRAAARKPSQLRRAIRVIDGMIQGVEAARRHLKLF